MFYSTKANGAEDDLYVREKPPKLGKTASCRKCHAITRIHYHLLRTLHPYQFRKLSSFDSHTA